MSLATETVLKNIYRVEVGESAATAKFIYNVMRVEANRSYRLTPSVVMNVKQPIRFLPSHSWVTVRLYLKTKTDAFDDYYTDRCDSTEIPYLIVKAYPASTDIYPNAIVWDDSEWDDADEVPIGEIEEYILNGGYLTNIERVYLEYEDAVWVYNLVGKEFYEA